MSFCCVFPNAWCDTARNVTTVHHVATPHATFQHRTPRCNAARQSCKTARHVATPHATFLYRTPRCNAARQGCNAARQGCNAACQGCLIENHFRERRQVPAHRRRAYTTEHNATKPKKMGARHFEGVGLLELGQAPLVGERNVHVEVLDVDRVLCAQAHSQARTRTYTHAPTRARARASADAQTRSQAHRRTSAHTHAHACTRTHASARAYRHARTRTPDGSDVGDSGCVESPSCGPMR
jgi:hypothetical protein